MAGGGGGGGVDGGGGGGGAAAAAAGGGGPTVVHKVKSKLGYTEMHGAAPGFSEDDLSSSSPDQRNWKGIGIAVFVIAVILSCVAAAVVALSPDAAAAGRAADLAGRSPVTVEMLLDPKFKPRRFNGSWLSDHELLHRDAAEGLSILDVRSMRQTQIVANSTFRRFNAARWWLSPNRRLLLLAHDVLQRYRYSTFSRYTIYEIATGLSWPLSAGSDASPAAQSHPRLLHAQWMAPLPGAASAGAAPVLFVEDYNLYYLADAGAGRGSRWRVFPISPPGTAVPEVVIHGVPDWIYEEDVLKRSDAVWPSPDGRRIVYATFNDTAVEEVKWQVYESKQEGATEKSYPTEHGMRYPKAGSTNPTVSLWLVELDEELKDLQTTQLVPPTKFSDPYLSAVSFSPDGDSVAVNWMTRRQDEAVVLFCPRPHWNCKEAYREDVTGWSRLTSPVIFPSSASSPANLRRFLVRAPVRDGDFGAFLQLAMVEVRDAPSPPSPPSPSRPSLAGSRSHSLPMGHLEVVQALTWDERNSRVFVLGIPASAPSQRHLYLVGTQWGSWSDEQLPECLTCQLQPEQLGGRQCLFNSVTLNPSLTHYVLECLGPGPPGIFLVSLEPEVSASNDTWQNSSSSSVRPISEAGPRFPVWTLDDNADLRQALASVLSPSVELLNIPTNDRELPLPRDSLPEERLPIGRAVGEDRTIRAKLHLPPHLGLTDDHEDVPLVVHVYGGPGHQLVTDEWKFDFNWVMVTLLGLAVLEVDGAGSGGRGQSLAAMVTKRLGGPEVDDQLLAVRYISSHYRWINTRRLGVTGVSYGGYMSLRMLSAREDDSGVLMKCGVAVSPVFDWKFYETAYSERYLGLPSENENAYIKSSLVDRVRFLRGRGLLLAHGLADRNVQVQHTMVLSKALVRAGVRFQQHLYPDEGHSLAGVRRHLFHAVADFLKTCLSGQGRVDMREDGGW